MSTITFDPAETPRARLGEPAAPGPSRPARDPGGTLVYLPLAISATVNLIFFVVHWLPEFGTFPTRDAWLTQLTPLASVELASEGQAVVAIQQGRSGLVGGYLLLAALTLPVLARSPRWQLRVLGSAVLVYLAMLLGVVTLIGTLARGQVGETRAGLLLLAAWLGCAAYAGWRGLWAPLARWDRRHRPRVLWLLVGYAVVGPVPLAVGRACFAPRLRAVAEDLSGSPGPLRWAALINAQTPTLYLAGLCLGLVVWAGFRVLVPGPPRLPPWLHLAPPAQLAGRGFRLLVLGAALASLALTGPAAAAGSAQLEARLRTASPVGDLAFPCGAWVDAPTGRPAQTLALSGTTCQRVTLFTGYRTATTGLITPSASPVRVSMLDGNRIPGRTVTARYDGVVVVAATDRADLRATVLVGLRFTDAGEAWRYRCPDGPLAGVRFGTSVVVGCGQGTVALDPATGRPLV